MPNFRLAVLLCDDLPIPLPDDPVKYINYDKIYHQFLAESLAEITWGERLLPPFRYDV